MTDKQLVGFIGVGVMGRPMAINLMAKGIPLLAYDVNPDAMQAIRQAGAQTASSVQDVCNRCRIVFTSMPSPAVFTQVLLGEAGVHTGYGCQNCGRLVDGGAAHHQGRCNRPARARHRIDRCACERRSCWGTEGNTHRHGGRQSGGAG